MPLTTKTVYDTLYRPDGTPWAEARVQFELRPGSFVFGNHVPPAKVEIVTNSTGHFEVELWPNMGDIPSAYVCTLPNREIFGFILSETDPDPISLSVLRAAGITEQAPQYETILGFITEYLSTVGLGDATQVALNPPIAGLGTTVQGAISALDGRSGGDLQLPTQSPLGGGRAVSLDPGGLVYADSGIPGHAQRVIGITVNSAEANTNAIVRSDGSLFDSAWTWPVGATLYLGSNGLISITPPSAPSFIQVLGQAIASNTILIRSLSALEQI